MRILFLSDTERQGGAGIAAARLAEGLQRAGNEIVLAVRDPLGKAPAGPWRRIIFDGPKLEWEQVPDAAAERLVADRFRALLRNERPDAVSIHNIHGGLKEGFSPALVREAAVAAPIAWTLHDMWSFTGCCAYDEGCGRYASGCDEHCPSWSDYPRYSPASIAQAYAEKRKLIAGTAGLAAVTPSAWLGRRAVRGGWPEDRVRVIANGLDLERYKPGSQEEARRALGIDREAQVILFAAHNLNDPRKGGDTVRRALQLAQPRARTLLLLGGGNVGIDVPGVRCVALGSIKGSRKVDVYRAADCYLHAALQDNLPNTVMEALAVGIPCVGFNSAGVSEMVTDGVTGYLVPAGDAHALAGALDVCLYGTDRESMGRACRASARERYDVTSQAATYMQLFSELALERNRALARRQKNL